MEGGRRSVEADDLEALVVRVERHHHARGAVLREGHARRHLHVEAGRDPGGGGGEAEALVARVAAGGEDEGHPRVEGDRGRAEGVGVEPGEGAILSRGRADLGAVDGELGPAHPRRGRLAGADQRQEAPLPEGCTTTPRRSAGSPSTVGPTATPRASYTVR